MRFFLIPGHEHYQGSSQHWRGGKRGGGTSISISIYGTPGGFCLSNLHGGKGEAECECKRFDDCDHFDLNFRMRYPKPTPSPGDDIICPRPSAPRHPQQRERKRKNNHGCDLWVSTRIRTCLVETHRKTHRPLIDRSSTAHRPLIDHYEKPHRPLFLNIKRLMKTNLSFLDQEMRSMWVFIAVDERSMSGR